jgi:hypothetical protein
VSESACSAFEVPAMASQPDASAMDVSPKQGTCPPQTWLFSPAALLPLSEQLLHAESLQMDVAEVLGH